MNSLELACQLFELDSGFEGTLKSHDYILSFQFSKDRGYSLLGYKVAFLWPDSSKYCEKTIWIVVLPIHNSADNVFFFLTEDISIHNAWNSL